MKTLTIYIATAFLLPGCSTTKISAGSANDRQALENTSIGIRTSFAKGDVPAILSYHHPDVVKALGYKTFLNGRSAVEADLKGTLEKFALTFAENKVESLLINGNTATEISLFTIEGKPHDGSKPFLFKGRAMVVYVRYKNSPSGWASIREVIQPSTQ